MNPAHSKGVCDVESLKKERGFQGSAMNGRRLDSQAS